MQPPAISYPLAVLIALSAFSPSLTAQSRDSTRLKDIVVTATRSPTPLRAVGSSADLLRPEELARRQVGTLREALQLTPGGSVVATGGPGGVTSVFLRGVSSSQTLFLVDGIRVNDANTSYASFLGGADLAGMGRLEIVRGAQSTLYGGAAIGGVVSLDAAGGEGRPNGVAEANLGSFATWRGRLSGQGTTGRIGVAVSLTANGTDNERHSNDWHQRTQLVRLDYPIASGFRAGATFRGLQQDYTTPGDLRTTNTTPVEPTSFESKLGTVWLEWNPTARWRSRLLGGLQEQTTTDTSRYNGGPESAFTLRNTRRVLDWQNTVSLAPRVVVIGGLNREWSTAVSNGGDGQDERLWALYGEAQLTPIEPLSLTTGVRIDDYNTFARATTYRLTAAWRFDRIGTKLRASLGTGFMPPSLAARFGSGYQNPNPGIRPERSRGWDAGVDQTMLDGRARIGVTWFYNALRDLIGFESAPFPEKGREVNVDRARTSGIELSGHVTSGPVDARLAYTLLSARSLSETDSALIRLIRRPRHTANGDVLFSITSRGRAGAGVLIVANREDTDFNTFPSQRVNPGDYAVARLYGSWDASARLTVQARIENLFNTRYEPVYGFPALGRSLSGSMAVRF